LIALIIDAHYRKQKSEVSNQMTDDDFDFCPC
jgi:hypothetical protein